MKDLKFIVIVYSGVLIFLYVALTSILNIVKGWAQ